MTTPIHKGTPGLDTAGQLLMLQETEQMHAVSACATTAEWHALFMTAILALRDPSLPELAGQAMVISLSNLIGQIFRHAPGCRQQLMGGLTEAMQQHNLLVDAAEKQGEAAIPTFTGKSFTPAAPKIEDICIEDIAHALANQCRYAGHTRAFYSVAQHCVIASQWVSEKYALAVLLHDAAEAYLCDVPRPIKRLPWLLPYREAELRLQKLIFARFGIARPPIAAIAEADQAVASTEARDLFAMTSECLHFCEANHYQPLAMKIFPLAPAAAEDAFLRRFAELTRSEPSAVSLAEEHDAK